MNPTPYLTFQGTCREAMAAYAEVFGGEVTMMMIGADMPEIEIPEGKANWIMHSELSFDGGKLMASDDMMGSNPAMAGSSVMMECASAGAAASAFAALTDGGEVIMPYGPTPWTVGFGMVTDRFGTRWMIAAPSGTP